jgi:hypothetical protein
MVKMESLAMNTGNGTVALLGVINEGLKINY